MKPKLPAMMLLAIAASFINPLPSKSCTGITLKSKDQTTIVARTIEWGGSNLNSQYVVIPRGHTQQSYIPGGIGGMSFTARYGYVGLAVEQKDFVAEGLNEVGLSAGLFYFPNYGKYEDYDVAKKEKSIADLQLVSWLLGECKTVGEVKEAVKKVSVISIDPRASTIHWRFTDTSGQQLVLEIIDGVPVFYENKLGVLANSPGFEWHMTNLNNYVNLFTGTASAKYIGNTELKSFGAGSGFLGMPGDITSPSRFVRAAFYQTSAPQQDTALSTVLQCFQILNSFDIPVGIEFPIGQVPSDIPSATQWTSATDMEHRIIYFRTMYNSTIRSIDLNTIDFSNVTYRAIPMDIAIQQPIDIININ
ncbi:linear amide C-N hydrolase [Dysgonomonas macrotermitis]|uniref:Choloylglycine hydrolase n=1 Tax=Dysgonomonas macrotermitis TaxID=1346286 RepID=A0A1M5BIL1_9BACT|nr:choloylglycine hydrolase family protein [Dysgonomonas macrotermitis]SHF42434.1 choloylglycine hydrolase [Dysgonomonas macrotermitis]